MKKILYVFLAMFMAYSCHDPGMTDHEEDVTTQVLDGVMSTRSLHTGGESPCQVCDLNARLGLGPCYLHRDPSSSFDDNDPGRHNDPPEISDPPEPSEIYFNHEVSVRSQGYNGSVYIDKDGGSISVSLSGEIVRGETTKGVAYPYGYPWIITSPERNASFFVGVPGGQFQMHATSIRQNLVISRGPNAGTSDKYIKLVFGAYVDYVEGGALNHTYWTYNYTRTLTVVQPGGSSLPENIIEYSITIHLLKFGSRRLSLSLMMTMRDDIKTVFLDIEN